MRAAIFNPYLDTLGGGERYTLSFAKSLIKKGYAVDLQWDNTEIVKNLESRFGLKLKNINIVPDVKRGDGYDLCFWVSDGSIPALRSRRNFIHFQVPFHDVGGSSLMNKMKLFRIEKVLCNSLFTKRFIDKEYGVESLVIYPPVDTETIKPRRKENIILSVGRFSHLLQSKRQDVLIEAFKKFYDGGRKDWRLILAGGVEVGDNLTEKLTQSAEGYPVSILKSPSGKILNELYGKSKIYWNASGFGEDEMVNPEKVEHFGITAVEAMSAGSVPFLLNAGGFKEIVREGVSGYLWTGETELVEKTNSLLNAKQKLKEIATVCIKESREFSYDKFYSNVNSLL